MSQTSFQVVYDGPALAGSTIDVKELAPALLALGDVIEQANITLNDGHTKIALRVNASFKSGCFGIDFSVVQSLLDQALGLFKQTPVASAKELVELLGFVGGSVVGGGVGVIKVIQWLRNRTIKEVVLLDNGRVRIMVDGDSLETELATIELLRNFRLRQALQQAIMDPLERNGYESVAITDGSSGSFVVIEKRDRHYFAAPPAEEEVLSDKEDTANLQIVSVSFRDDNKWRFTDGANSFYAAIMDDGFLNKVRMAEESFTAGDILTVTLRKRQWLSADTMKSEYEVLKVLDHRKAMAQLRIPFRDDESK